MSPRTRSRVLIVGTNATRRTATRRILEEAGFEVSECAAGADALDACLRAAPDILLLEVALGDLDGGEVCRRLRADARTGEIPVALVWAAPVKSRVRTPALESGADAYLSPPLDPALLVATLRAILRSRLVLRECLDSERRHRAIFERAPHGICVLDKDLGFVDVNPALCSILARSREQLLGQPARDFAYERIEEALQQQGTWRGTLPHTADDGHLQMLDWTLSVHSGTGLRLGLVTDATERRLAEEDRERLLSTERASRAEAERASRRKDELLSALSHELRSPLNAILGWTHLLAHGEPPPAGDWSRGLEVIQRNARAQAQLISDMLDLGSLASGKLALSVTRVDPAAAIRSAVENAGGAARAKQVHIECAPFETTGEIPGDPARIRQAIEGLLSNALRCSSVGGGIEVGLRRADGGIEIAVTDHGSGLEAEMLPHAFDHLREDAEGATRSAGGLGLALAVAKGLAELHGGSARASSAGAGRGATFALSFPDAEHSPLAPQAPRSQARTERRAHADLDGTRIVVVDDDDDARSVVCRVLRSHGAEVRDAGDVESALGVIEEFSPQVLISDIGMPVQDGYDLIRRLHAPQVSAIALTAYARDDDRRRALDAGFNLHLPKPVDPDVLVDAVRSLAVAGRG